MTSPVTANTIQQRTVPSTGTSLPVIGCGTWENFDVGSRESERAPLVDVFRNLFSAGGTVVDSSPMYGKAEQVAGDLLRLGAWSEKAFVATKIWTQGREAGIQQMRRSVELLGRVDLMQVHNLVDWRTHLVTMRGWKADGLIRYIGVTHYTSSAHADLEDVMRREPLDFVQLNYSIEEREAERRLLPLAVDRGIAVIVNVPFGAGRVLRALRKHALPSWAVQYGCETWAQLFLKFVLAQPAVTCAIPGTGNPKHMIDNCRAGMGKRLDASHCDELKKLWDEKRP